MLFEDATEHHSEHLEDHNSESNTADPYKMSADVLAYLAGSLSEMPMIRSEKNLTTSERLNLSNNDLIDSTATTTFKRDASVHDEDVEEHKISDSNKFSSFLQHPHEESKGSMPTSKSGYIQIVPDGADFPFPEDEASIQPSQRRTRSPSRASHPSSKQQTPTRNSTSKNKECGRFESPQPGRPRSVPRRRFEPHRTEFTPSERSTLPRDADQDTKERSVVVTESCPQSHEVREHLPYAETSQLPMQVSVPPSSEADMLNFDTYVSKTESPNATSYPNELVRSHFLEDHEQHANERIEDTEILPDYQESLVGIDNVTECSTHLKDKQQVGQILATNRTTEIPTSICCEEIADSADRKSSDDSSCIKSGSEQSSSVPKRPSYLSAFSDEPTIAAKHRLSQSCAISRPQRHVGPTKCTIELASTQLQRDQSSSADDEDTTSNSLESSRIAGVTVDGLGDGDSDGDDSSISFHRPPPNYATLDRAQRLVLRRDGKAFSLSGRESTI
eukprot:gene6109-9170_t